MGGARSTRTPPSGLLVDALSPSAPAADAAAAPALAPFLGSSAAFYLFPFAGVPMGGAAPKPKVAASFDLRDRAGFEAAFQRRLQIAQAANPTLKVDAKPFHKFPFFTFTLGASASADASKDDADEGPKRSGGQSGGDVTFAILDDRVVVAPSKEDGSRRDQANSKRRTRRRTRSPRKDASRRTRSKRARWIGPACSASCTSSRAASFR
jgi:hypothetical protein